MFGLSYSELFSCLAIGVGIWIIAYVLFKKSKREGLLKDGEKAEGIVFEAEYSKQFWISTHSRDSVPVKDKITIRFVTKELEWITADLDETFAIYYTVQYKTGDKVKVIYNPKNPHEFSVTTGQSETLSKVTATVVGLALIFGGLYSLFFTVQS